MSALDELQDTKNWSMETEYGPHDYSGIVYSWIGRNTPIDLADEAAAELVEYEKFPAALEEAMRIGDDLQNLYETKEKEVAQLRAELAAAQKRVEEARKILISTRANDTDQERRGRAAAWLEANTK